MRLPFFRRSEVGDVDGLTEGGAPGHGGGELHVAHPVFEGRSLDRLAAADRADELLFDPPADPPVGGGRNLPERVLAAPRTRQAPGDRKSTRLKSSHSPNSDAVFCLKKK